MNVFRSLFSKPPASSHGDSSMSSLSPGRQSRLYDSDEEGYVERTPTIEIVLLGKASMFSVSDDDPFTTLESRSTEVSRKQGAAASRDPTSRRSFDRNSAPDNQQLFDAGGGVNHLYTHYGQQLDQLWNEREKQLQEKRRKQLILGRFTTTQAVCLSLLLLVIVVALLVTLALYVISKYDAKGKKDTP